MTAEEQARFRVTAASDQLLELSHRIHAHPETAWREHLASGWLSDALDRLGYTVTRHPSQLPTAFTASIGTGELNIGIRAEYDALPGLGHACGHNIIAAAIGAAPIHRLRRRRAMSRASTDMGSVSLRLPVMHPHLGINSLPAVNHQPEFAAHCAGPAADRAVLDGAIALAATVIDAATHENVRDHLLHRLEPGLEQLHASTDQN